MFRYKMYAPAEVLRPFVHCYSIVENTVPLSYNLLPRATLILGICYSGALTLSVPGSPALFRSGLMGMQDTYRVFRKTAHTGILAVNFTEAGAAAFFREPLHELYNNGCTLDQLVGREDTARLEEQIAAAAGADERVRITDAFLCSILRHTEPDHTILAALDAIVQAGGVIRTEALAGQLYISSGRLEKRFRAVVGTTPKKFASMIRIRSVIRRYRNGTPLTSLAYDSGYFDQAHFNRDFKHCTGMSPRQLFSHLSVSPDGLLQPSGLIYGAAISPALTDSL